MPLRCVPKPDDGSGDLVVAAGTGEVWTGDAAWLMVLWALDDYREWSRRLSSPTLLPMARQALPRSPPIAGGFLSGWA